MNRFYESVRYHVNAESDDQHVTVIVCRRCGVVVYDTAVHNAFHQHSPETPTSRSEAG